MENKYSRVGLNQSLIEDKYKDLNEYDNIVNFYFDDENFKLLKNYLENEDYALAKDATKGLYILAGELMLYPIYEKLIDIYDDLESEEYTEVLKNYEEMIKVYERVRSVFYV